MEAYLYPENQSYIRFFDFPGNQPSVIYLAGLGFASTAAYPRIVIEPGLSDRHSILVDLFGCGYSDRPDQFGYSLEEHASTLSSLLDHIGLKECILVGHSMGGAVAIELAAKRSDIVIQLVLAEANLHAGGGLLSRNIANQTEADFVTRGHHELLNNRRTAALAGDQVNSIALGILQVTSPFAFHRSATGLVKGTQPVMWDQLIQLPIPRTYIFGSRSLEEFADDRALRKSLEAHGIQVAIVPNAGHGMMGDNPTGFAKVISEALDYS